MTPSHVHRGLLPVLLSGLFITNVDVAVVNVAAPTIQERLQASGPELQLAVSGYVLTYAMLLITGARLGDMYGFRRLFLAGVAVFTLASVGCGIAPNPAALILFRLVQGLGAALLVPQVLLGLQLSFSGPERTRALGFYSLALSVGAVAAVAWGLVGYAAACSTYFSLLFILALYLQQGLGRSPLYSGLALLSWVAAFGAGGPLVLRLSPRARASAAPLGFLLLSAAYAAISATSFTNHLPGAALIALLGLGGLGLGIAFTANIRHLTDVAPRRYAADLSGLITTVAQLAGLMGVAGFGTAYLGWVAAPHALSPARAFAFITASFALTAAFAAFALYRSSSKRPLTASRLGGCQPEA